MARRKSSPQEREARAAADRELRGKADEMLTNPDAVDALVEQLLQMRSPKMLRYSLRNQAMLVAQAADRGISLVDVDTFRGWLARGRGVRKGEQGLRIVTPVGREAVKDTEPEQPGAAKVNTGPAEGATDDAEESRARFAMTAVFDISQTEGIEDAEVDEAAEVASPRDELAAALTEQLTRRRYEIEEDPRCEHATVDDGNLVSVPPGRPVRELARAVAIVLIAGETERTPSSITAA